MKPTMEQWQRCWDAYEAMDDASVPVPREIRRAFNRVASALLDLENAMKAKRPSATVHPLRPQP